LPAPQSLSATFRGFGHLSLVLDDGLISNVEVDGEPADFKTWRFMIALGAPAPPWLLAHDGLRSLLPGYPSMPLDKVLNLYTSSVSSRTAAAAKVNNGTAKWMLWALAFDPRRGLPLVAWRHRL